MVNNKKTMQRKYLIFEMKTNTFLMRKYDGAMSVYNMIGITDVILKTNKIIFQTICKLY